jgi:DNA repair exonuclease SbcCD nuclease subunit
MLNIVHAADLHLDTPFAALPPELAAARRSEQREIPARIADLASERRADLVLLAGDLFDGENVYTETIESLMAALGRISAPVLIAPGNHDFYSPRSPYALRWPQNVHIFKSSAMERVVFPNLGCAVYGSAFTAPSCETSLLSGFHAEEDADLLRLMVLHGEVGGPDGPYDSLPEEQVAGSGLHYLALGHVHSFSGIRRAGSTVWAWPGCPEGRGFDETGPKGVIAGTVHERGADLNFVPLCRRRYEIRNADITGFASAADALKFILPELTEQNIYRIILTGESGAEGLSLEPLSSLLRGLVYHAELRDATRVKKDIWARAGEDSLTGLFLKGMRRRYDEAAEDEARAAVELAVRFGLAALENREDPAAAR